MYSTPTDIPSSNGGSFIDGIRQFFQYFGSYVSFVVMVFGIVGNTLSIVIFIKRRKQDKASAQYLGTLAVVDLGNLCVALNFWIHLNIHYITNGLLTKNKVTPSTLACQIYLYVWNVFTFASAYLVVCFSIERCLVIWLPLRMSAMLSSSKPRKIVIVLIFSVAILVFWTNFLWTELRSIIPGKPEQQACTFRADITRQEQTFNYLLSIGVNAIIPCFLVTVLNVAILIGISHNRMGAAKHSTNDSKKEMRCLKNLIAVSSFYFLFNVPFAVTWTLYLLAAESGFKGYSADGAQNFGEVALFTTSVTYLNYSINPVVYTLSLDFYRNECKQIMCHCLRLKNKKDQGR